MASSAAVCPTRSAAPLDHNVVITALDTVWLPAAFSPRQVSNPSQVRYDEESSSLLIRRSSLPDGFTYQVRVDGADRHPDRAPGHRGGPRPPAHPGALPGAAVRLPRPVPGPGRADHRRRQHAVRAGAGAAELVPHHLHLRRQRAPRPRRHRHRCLHLAAPRVLRAVRRDVRRLRPLDRAAGPGGRGVHARRARLGRSLPRPGPQRPRLARGLLRRHRMAALRTDPRPG